MKQEVWITTSIAALAGGVLWGMANIFSIVFAPKPPARREVIRALVASLFALITALIGGYFVAPWIVQQNHIESVETISIVGLLVGMGFWASVPMAIHLTTKMLPALFGNVGAVLSNAASADPGSGEESK